MIYMTEQLPSPAKSVSDNVFILFIVCEADL